MSSGASKPGCGCIPPRTPRSQSRSAGRIPRSTSRGPQALEPSSPKTVSIPPVPTFLSTLLACDRRQSKWVYEHCQGPILHKVLRVFEWSGDGLFWLPVTAAIWLSPRGASPETRMFFFNLFIGFIFDLFLVGVIKVMAKRKRPRYNRDQVMVVAADQWSFPSGHSTRALMIVTFVWLYYPMWQVQAKTVWMPYLLTVFGEDTYIGDVVLPSIGHSLISIFYTGLMVWALAITTSRVVLGRHYILDVVGGVVIGILAAVFAHFFLFVPEEVSELQHQWSMSRFGTYKDYVQTTVLGRWFFPGGRRR